MKVTLEVELEGGLNLPATAEINKFSDVRKLGAKLTALVSGANKLVSGVGDRKVLKIRLPKDKADAA